MRRDPRIAGVVQVAVLSPADESRVACGVKPPAGLAIHHKDDWRAGVAGLVRAAIATLGALGALASRRTLALLATASPSALPSTSTAASIAIRSLASLAAVQPRTSIAVASARITVAALTRRRVAGGCVAGGCVVTIAVWPGFARWRRRGVGVGSEIGLGVGRCRLEVGIGIRRNIRSRAATRFAAPATG